SLADANRIAELVEQFARQRSAALEALHLPAQRFQVAQFHRDRIVALQAAPGAIASGRSQALAAARTMLARCPTDAPGLAAQAAEKTREQDPQAVAEKSDNAEHGQQDAQTGQEFVHHKPTAFPQGTQPRGRSGASGNTSISVPVGVC